MNAAQHVLTRLFIEQNLGEQEKNAFFLELTANLQHEFAYIMLAYM